jgi:hypothetical protein
MRDSAIATADDPHLLEVRLAIDSDDPTGAEYPKPDYVSPMRLPVSYLFNALADRCTAEIVGAMGDDVIFRTKGWDTKVRAVYSRYPDGLFIASPMNGDGLERVNHWFTGRQWIDLFGWFMPAHFEHFGDDKWVQDVSSACGRLIYMRDVLIEHMHKKFNKAPNDTTYQQKRLPSVGGSMAKRDEALIVKMAPQMQSDRAKLAQAIGL